MKYIIAVSGGVDSVVLLDTMVKDFAPEDLVIAHFDHGIRDDSHEDALFVEALAESYDLVFETKREELGPSASEALARERRYEFLRDLTNKYEATIATGHHKDDLVETVAINLQRGTGWRGLAVLDSGAYRPLLVMTKNEVIQYALKNSLEWREDSTNSSDAYLRNRLRYHTKALDKNTVDSLAELRGRQVEIKSLITTENNLIIDKIKSTDGYSRYFFSNTPEEVALEVLRHVSGGLLTRPQTKRLLLAIKTYAPGKKYEAGAGIIISFTTRYFTL